MAVIPLNADKYAIVDDGIQPYLLNFIWSAKKQRNYYYACRNRLPNDTTTPGTERTIYLHREIMRLHNIDMPPGYVIDHINRNGLDNRLQNLRVVTVQQNARNGAIRCARSGYIGVTWDDKVQMWKASIVVDGRVKFICHSHDKITAAIYRDRAAAKNDKFATLNFPSMIDEQHLGERIEEYVLTEEDKALLEKAYLPPGRRRCKPVNAAF